MERYKNLSGSSGVIAFEIGDDWIVVEFAGEASAIDRRYRYTVARAGAPNILEMKRLAQSGRGLATFIARNRPAYEDERR